MSMITLPLTFLALAGVVVVPFLFSVTLAFFVAAVDDPDVTEWLLSIEIRLMSDLSDLVEESVSRRLRFPPLPISSSIWLVKVEFEVTEVTVTADVDIWVVAAVDGVSSLDWLEAVLVVVVGGVEVANKGFNKLPPPGTKSDCCTGDLLTRGWRVIVLVTVVEGATVVLFTSMFKGCSIEVDFVTSTDAAEVVAAFVCWYLKEMKKKNE